MLSLDDATGNLARWSLRLSEYELDVVRQPGLEKQAVEALLHPVTYGLKGSQVEEDISVLALEQILPVWRNEEEDHLVCSVCEDTVNKLPETQKALADETTNNINEPPAIQEFINEQSKEDFCKTPASFVGMPGLQYSDDWSGFRIVEASINRAFQKVVPKSLQARILRHSNCPTLSGLSKERNMNETLRQDY